MTDGAVDPTPTEIRILAGAWRRPAPRLLTVWRLQSLALLAVLGAMLTAVAALVSGVAAAGAALACTAAASAVAWRVSSARWRAWGYAERSDDLLVRRGVLVRRVSVVPYGRMQFVDVSAGPLDRRLGLATVSLHTAAAASDAHIPGLDSAEATRLRDRLAALGETRAAGL